MRLTFVVCLLAAHAVSGQKIIWEEGRKLTWENFRSPVNRKKNPDVAAYTHCGWEFYSEKSSDPKAPVKITIKTLFHEDKSWKDVKKMDDYILLHEQKHFDIAELFVRKFRKAVAEKIKNSGDYNRYFKAIYDGISADYKNFQMAYDRETRHGIDKEKQTEYNQSISEQLDNLKSYQTL
ncbi:hypothetical protein J2795_001855 [Chryseobacterium bernardetii]|uniref:Uncharacterized protein n=2 Tax=Chryseobacterium TaxID=59732 RepID=A0ACC6ITV0_9FLAO|nr:MULTISPECIES: DUF922 domain-containing protein [Chryseobacterium]MDR6371099.1 hypothetical protein [Chryseobacterium vietnamense]MDR6441155.1 hypothetical protein [Chryseobacterium bernardetii]MDR6457608.1 hypothetical protein [Chryseobacterium vietnamense]MDR6486343.1 hypothetical protein [Chryseobacterium vietnamense]